MKKIITFLTLLPVLANAEQVPHNFTSGTPAKAAEVNANFTHINDKSTLNTSSITANEAKLAAIEAKLNAIEISAETSDFDLLENGEVSVEVDCTNKPEALQLAYHEHINYRSIKIGITGSCYGHIASIRGDDDPTNAVQVAGQTVSIYSSDQDNRANIIPNDETGRTQLIGGFGGGLYITRVNITAAPDMFAEVLFSRNGHGGLSESTVTASGTEAIPVVVQEGAGAYFDNLEINGALIGIFARNNASIRFLSETTVNSTQGIVLRAGVSVNHQGGVAINSGSGQALYMNGGVDWIATDDWRPLTVTGNIHMESDAYLNAGTLQLTGDINAFDSKLKSQGFANITGNTNLDNSTAAFDSGTDAAPASFNCHGISSLTINGWEKVNAGVVDDSTNCADKAAWDQALFNIFDNLNTPQ